MDTMNQPQQETPPTVIDQDLSALDDAASLMEGNVTKLLDRLHTVMGEEETKPCRESREPDRPGNCALSRSLRIIAGRLGDVTYQLQIIHDRLEL